MARIVNLFGGPGAGKSTTRAGVFNRLKLAGVKCEEVVEWVKYKVYEKSEYVFTDQMYVFAKQRKWLRQVADHVDIVVTDSPILLSSIYGDPNDDLFNQLILREFNSFNNINFLINRTKPYAAYGRNQTEDEAHGVDRQIENFLIEHNIPFIEVIGNEMAAQVITNYVILGQKFPH